MPAEGIHLSALADTVVGADSEIARLLDHERAAARLGAILVDFPYFDRFPMRTLYFAMKRPFPSSSWGDRLHQEAPARVGLELLRCARAVEGFARPAALAMALGYLSHAAVDTAIHPLVNRLARVRAKKNGTAPLVEHMDVEKFQSVLFHEKRMGRDLMGSPEIRGFIELDTALFLRALHPIVDQAFLNVFGANPSATTWRSWMRGYRQYSWVLGSPIGRLPAPDTDKAREKPALYDEVDFESEFKVAVVRSRAYVTAGMLFVEEDNAERYFASVPEGSIDAG